MAQGPAEDLHAAVAAVAAHRQANAHFPSMSADAMVKGDQLDDAVEEAQKRFHAAGGTAEHADRIIESAYGSLTPRSRLNEFHSARQGRGNG
jgi:hypothetical protein